jgi:hypothetical protein
MNGCSIYIQLSDGIGDKCTRAMVEVNQIEKGKNSR